MIVTVVEFRMAERVFCVEHCC